MSNSPEIPLPARHLGRCIGVCLGFVAFASAAFSQLSVDPDPEIFDGGKLAVPDIPQDEQEPEKMTDDWEQGPSVIIYASTAPLVNIPIGNGEGLGGLPGLPGMGMGGGGGAPGLPSMPSPMSIGMGDGQQIPQGQQGPQGPQATPSAAGAGKSGKPGASTAGAAASSARPSDVSIGDPSKQIQTRGQGQAGNTPDAATGGEPGAREAGEDTTEMPKVGQGTPQTGNRGGGVEEGDAMDPSQM